MSDSYCGSVKSSELQVLNGCSPHFRFISPFGYYSIIPLLKPENTKSREELRSGDELRRVEKLGRVDKSFNNDEKR